MNRVLLIKGSSSFQKRIQKEIHAPWLIFKDIPQLEDFSRLSILSKHVVFYDCDKEFVSCTLERRRLPFLKSVYLASNPGGRATLEQFRYTRVKIYLHEDYRMHRLENMQNLKIITRREFIQVMRGLVYED